MRYLVTGATGFIGSRLVRRLQAAGHGVVLFTRRADAAAPLLAPGSTVALGDVTDAAAVEAAMAGCDGVFHLAAWRGGNRALAAPINVDGTKNVLIAMRKLGIAKGVYTSTLAVNSDTGGVLVDESHVHLGRHLRLYDETKWLAHHGIAGPLAAAGVPVVVLLPGMVCGPGNPDLFKQFLRGRLTSVPRRSAACWSHVDDCVQAHLLAMERGEPGCSYIIGGPAATAVEVFQLAGRITGLPPPKRTIPPWAMKTAAALTRPFAGWPRIGWWPEYLRVAAGTTYIGDDTRARTELGWQRRDLEATLRDTLLPMAEDLGIRLTPPAG